MRAVRGAAVLAAAAAAAFALGTAPALASHSFPERWSPGVVAVVDRTCQPGWTRATGKAIRSWSSALVPFLRLRLVPDPARCGGGGDVCEAVPGAILACNREPAPGTLGGADWSARHDGASPITWAVVYLPPPSYAPVLQEQIACHELGHALGLAHSGDETSVMHENHYTCIPNAHDVEALRAKYAGVGARAAAMAAAEPVALAPGPRPLALAAGVPEPAPARGSPAGRGGGRELVWAAAVAAVLAAGGLAAAAVVHTARTARIR